MKLTVKKPVEIEADTIRCCIPVRYEEEDIPNNFPFRDGDMWEIFVDIETGKILDWPAGFPATRVQMKVTDNSRYYLMCNGDEIAARDNDYVPPCVPGKYGDYIDFKIDANGIITNWKAACDADAVEKSFFPEDDD